MPRAWISPCRKGAESGRASVIAGMNRPRRRGRQPNPPPTNSNRRDIRALSRLGGGKVNKPMVWCVPPAFGRANAAFEAGFGSRRRTELQMTARPSVPTTLTRPEAYVSGRAMTRTGALSPSKQGGRPEQMPCMTPRTKTHGSPCRREGNGCTERQRDRLKRASETETRIQGTRACRTPFRHPARLHDPDAAARQVWPREILPVAGAASRQPPRRP
jgi:hypothetical protein